MAIDCLRHLFLLVEDRLLPSPRLIDLYSVAVSSTKLCVYALSSHHLFTTCNIHCLFASVGIFASSPQEKPGDMALYPCSRLHYCLRGTLNAASVPWGVSVCTTANPSGSPRSPGAGE